MSYENGMYTPVQQRKKTYNKHFIRHLKASKGCHPCNPTQPLGQLHLDSYQVLDCEPLHDLKGHINNIITELPSILDPDIKTHYKQVLEADLSKEKKTGADYRLTLIHLVGVMHKQKAPEKVCTLLQTLAEMSRLLYLGK